MNNEEKTMVWDSPVAHAMDEVLKDYNDEIPIEDVIAIKRAQLSIELAWQIRERNKLLAQVEIIKEYLGGRND